MILAQANDPFALPAFIISIVAGAVALLSLAWSVTAWAWSGPRVKVRANTHATEEDQRVWAYIWNKGRAPIEIHHVEVHRSDDAPGGLIPLMGIEDPGLPYTLTGGAAVVMEETFLPQGTFYGARWYEIRVTLANGKVKRSRTRKRR